METPKKSESKNQSEIDSAKKTEDLAETLDLNEKEKKQMEAVKQNCEMIKYIDNPGEKVQLVAVKQNWEMIKYIDNPSEKVQLEVMQYAEREEKTHWRRIENYSRIIGYINNPSKKVRLKAVKPIEEALKKLGQPGYTDRHKMDLKYQLESDLKHLIKCTKNPSEEIQWEMLKYGWEMIKCINNPINEVQLAAVKQNWSAIKDIENPSKEVVLEAIKQYGGAIGYIKNPSEEVIKYVKSQLN